MFDQICVKDAVSWTALISGYAKQGQGNEALHRFDMMVRDGILPNSVTFLSILKACVSIGSLEKGGRNAWSCHQRGFVRKRYLAWLSGG